MGSSTPLRSSLVARAALGTLVALALLIAPTARAADPAELKARAEFKRGKTAYDLGRFEEALAAYSSAYEAKPLPAFLFNMAQCHRQMGNHERAVFFYKRYLSLSPGAKDEATVRKLIDDAEAKLAELEKKKAEELKKQEDARAAAALVLTPAPPTEPVLPKPGTTPGREASTPVYTTWWFWTVAAVVVVGAAAGTTAGVMASKPQPASMSLGTLNAR